MHGRMDTDGSLYTGLIVCIEYIYIQISWIIKRRFYNIYCAKEKVHYLKDHLEISASTTRHRHWHWHQHLHRHCKNSSFSLRKFFFWENRTFMSITPKHSLLCLVISANLLFLRLESFYLVLKWHVKKRFHLLVRMACYDYLK